MASFRKTAPNDSLVTWGNTAVQQSICKINEVQVNKRLNPTTYFYIARKVNRKYVVC